MSEEASYLSISIGYKASGYLPLYNIYYLYIDSSEPEGAATL